MSYEEEELVPPTKIGSKLAHTPERITQSRGLGRRIHGSVEDTKLSTNKQHSLSEERELVILNKRVYVFFFCACMHGGGN
jgi:hypothetical protein